MRIPFRSKSAQASQQHGESQHSTGNSDVAELRDFVRSVSDCGEDKLLFSAFQDVPADSRKALFSGAEGSQLALTMSRKLVDADRPDALWIRDVLQNDMGVRPAEASTAPFVLLTTEPANQARLSQAAYLVSSQRFKKEGVLKDLPKIAKELLLAGELSPETFMQTFSLSEKDATELLIEGKISYDLYTQQFELPLDDVERALSCGALTALQYLQSPGVDPSMATVMIEMNLLAVVDALPFLVQSEPQWSTFEPIRDFVKDGKVTWEQYVCSEAASLKAVRGAVQQEAVTPKNLRANGFAGTSRDVLVEALYLENRISRGDAIQHATSTWSAEKPFPKSVLDSIYAFKSDADLCRDLMLPGPAKDARNAPFLTRALSFWFAKQDYDLPENKQKRLAAAAKLLPAEIDAIKSCACIGCGDTFDPETTLNVLENCEHAPTMCGECFIGNFDANGEGWNCPDKLCCNRKLTPNEAFQLGLGQLRAEAIAIKVVGDARSLMVKALAPKKLAWENCFTKDCPNGLLLPYEKHDTLNCRCCGKQSEMLCLPPIVGKMTMEERAMARMIIADTKGIAKAANMTKYETPVVKRYCRACPILVERFAGCNLVTCKCGVKTDVVHGDPVASDRWGDGMDHAFGELLPMCYVPRQGWAVEIGLFKGAKQGQPVTAIMEKNLAILEAGGTL